MGPLSKSPRRDLGALACAYSLVLISLFSGRSAKIKSPFVFVHAFVALSDLKLAHYLEVFFVRKPKDGCLTGASKLYCVYMNVDIRVRPLLDSLLTPSSQLPWRTFRTRYYFSLAFSEIDPKDSAFVIDFACMILTFMKDFFMGPIIRFNILGEKF